MALVSTPPGELGAVAPDFRLRGVDGQMHALQDYAAASVLVVMFICNHCPYVVAVEDRLIQLARTLSGRDVRWVAINSNDPVNYPEDSFDRMVERARLKDYPFDYLMDDTQNVARAYGAVCTPDFFVYNRLHQLIYRGRLDDSPRNPHAVTREELREAIEAALEGQSPLDVQHPSMGCSIKWRG
jgi:peroxiredoxin